MASPENGSLEMINCFCEAPNWEVYAKEVNNTLNALLLLAVAFWWRCQWQSKAKKNVNSNSLDGKQYGLWCQQKCGKLPGPKPGNPENEAST